MSEQKDAIVRFDNTGHFEVVDDKLMTELGAQDTALVFGGATQTDAVCGLDTICPNIVCVGPRINVSCDTDGHRQLLTHGDHTLNIVC